MTDIAKLNGVVQHYAWGGYGFLPELLHLDNHDNNPHAEYWMGAHPKAPSSLEAGDTAIPLDQLIEAAPEAFLGKQVAARFQNRLPYLFKVLDVKDMLSIQAHPTKEAAEIGFAKENEAGIPLTAKHRNYRDDNHKPEIMVAMTDFWLLHGFRAIAEIQEVLHSVPEFASLKPYFEQESLYDLYKYIMELSQDAVNTILQPLADRIVPAYEAGELDKSDPAFWAARGVLNSPLPEGELDRGIFSIYLFNLVNIKEGDGIFQAAGIPHAYLEGVNMELMANSDNVLRGGLTPKHMDVPELLDKLIFESITPHILTGDQVSPTERAYPSPAPDFALSALNVRPDATYESAEGHAPDIVIVMAGSAQVISEQTELALSTGEVFCAAADVAYRIESETGATLYKATVPIEG